MDGVCSIATSSRRISSSHQAPVSRPACSLQTLALPRSSRKPTARQRQFSAHQRISLLKFAKASATAIRRTSGASAAFSTSSSPSPRSGPRPTCWRLCIRSVSRNRHRCPTAPASTRTIASSLSTRCSARIRRSAPRSMRSFGVRWSVPPPRGWPHSSSWVPRPRSSSWVPHTASSEKASSHCASHLPTLPCAARSVSAVG
mmetsp:Transcript_32283/g.64392  ORF Transcript_32283/g.64392 Transcript_32283/m.64392 type:complete len:201 (+) Transcript_32283:471-1073(+)